MSEDDFAPISGLQHLVFCERQCALIHIEGVWAENRLTAEGRLGHRNPDSGRGESRSGVRIARGLWLRSERLKLVGRADVVEFHHRSGRPEIVFPVEYKRGRLRKEAGSEVQLCAQALCLEEMVGVEISAGAIFFGKTRRRKEIVFDAGLRQKTEETARRLHALLAAGTTPPAEYGAKCRACSLLDYCLPRICGQKDAVGRYLTQALELQEDEV